MKVDISFNTNKNGVELRFDEKPDEATTSQLKAVGFKYSYRQNMWYASKTNSIVDFANNLKVALESGETTIAINLKPSFSSSEENIDHKNFSYVSIAAKDDEDKLFWENYIVFEPSKNIAEQLVSEFAKETFGDKLHSINIYPRNYVRKARQLFKEGNIIGEKSEPKEEQTKEPNAKPLVQSDRPLSKKDKLEILNAFGKFARKRQADFGNLEEEEMPLLFSGWLRVNHADLSDRKNEIWEEYYTIQNILNPDPEKPQIPPKDYHLFFRKFREQINKPIEEPENESTSTEAFASWLDENYTNITDADKKALTGNYDNWLKQKVKNLKALENLSKPKKMQPYSAIFKKLQKLITNLNEHLETGTPNGKSVLDSKALMDLSYDFLGQDKKGRYLIALAHYFSQNGDLVPDPDMQIRIDLELETGEAMHYQDQFGYRPVYVFEDGKELVNLKEKKEQNKFLSGWLSNLINQGHKLELVATENDEEEPNPEPETTQEQLKDEGILAHSGLTPDGIFQAFDKAYKQKNYEGAARELDVLLMDIRNGHHLESFPEAILRSQMTGMRTPMKKLGWAHYYRIIDDEQFKEALSANLWELVPKEYKQVKAIKPLDWKADPMDKGLQKIVASFVSKDEYRTAMLGVNFDKNGIIATNGFKLLFIPDTDHVAEGLYCISPKCWKAINVESKDGTGLSEADQDRVEQYRTQTRYPDYSSVIPSSLNHIQHIDAESLLGFLEGMKRSGFLKPDNYPVCLKVGSYFVGFAVDILIDSIKALLHLGITELELGVLEATKGCLLAEKGKTKDARGLQHPFVLMMPLVVDAVYERDYPDTGDVYFDTALNAVITKGIDEPKEQESELLKDTEEDIEIPFTKQTGYRGSIRLRTIPEKGFSYGNSSGKEFGDFSGSSSPSTPVSDKDIFSTKEKALKAAFDEHVKTLAAHIQSRDSIYNNEEQKLKKLRKALDELIAFAKTQGITISQIPDKSPAAKEGSIDFIMPAAWKMTDDEYPQNKVLVFGNPYNQSKLRTILLDRIEATSIQSQLELVKDIRKRFKERAPIKLESSSLVTQSKSGEKKHKAIIRNYLDDLILDNEIWKVPGATSGVLEYLVRYLLNEKTPAVKSESKPDKKPSNQHDLNLQIEEFIVEKDAEDEAYSEEDKQFIAQYTGSGGLIKQGASGKGVLYEYFTPEVIVQKMWGLAYKFGYSGGAVLEPSCGTGNFFKYAPKEAELVGYEINPYSVRIAEIIYPNASIYQQPFETIFFAGNTHLKDDFGGAKYELFIGNPPYGEFSGKWAGMGEKKWTGATEYDQYFITRGLDLLLPGGVLVFIIPSAFLSNNSKYNKLKEKVAAKADLVDAYRLPARMFKTTDIGTDIIVFKRKN